MGDSRLSKSLTPKRVNRLLIFAGSILMAVTSGLVNVFLARNMIVADYAELSLIITFVSILVTLMLCGQRTALTSIYFGGVEYFAGNFAAAVQASVKVILFSFMACLIFIELLFLFFEFGPLEIFYRNRYLIYVGAISSCFGLVFLNIFSIKRLGKSYFFSASCYFAGFILVVVFLPSVQGYIFGLAIASWLLIIISLMHGLLIKQSWFSIAGCKDMFFLGLPAVPATLVVLLNTFVDRYILASYLNLEIVGVYSIATFLIIGMGSVLIQSMLKAINMEMLNYLKQGNFEGFVDNVKIISYWFLLLLLMGFFVNFFVGNYLISIVFGSQYAGASRYLIILSFVVFLNGLASVCALPLIWKGYLNSLLQISVITFFSNLVLSLILVRYFDDLGVVFGLLLGSMVNYLLVNIRASAVRRIPLQGKFVLSGGVLVCIDLYRLLLA